jgi:4-hydroxy-2-oxoglutarate aldolase
LIGADAVFFAGLLYGMEGAILALANIAPNECVRLFQAVQENRFDEARNAAQRLAPLGRVIVARYGVAGLKAALDELGYFGGEPRPPLSALEEKAKNEIHETISHWRKVLERACEN